MSKNSIRVGEDDDRETLIKHRDSTRRFSEASKNGETIVRVISQTPTVKNNREKRRKLQGWHFGVACSAWTAFAVLLLNLALTM